MRRQFAVLTLVLAAACAPDAATPAPSGLGLGALLGSDDHAGFARAEAPPQLQFPADHGAHPEFRTEWWYWTGNLRSDAGRRFGIQLVFFRQALASSVPADRASPFATRDVVLAHAALTDVDGGRFHCAERQARAAAGLAVYPGPTGPAQPFALECGDWSARAENAADGFLPLRLRAGDLDFGLDLLVRPGKPLVLQGDAGLSQKSAAKGNASIYYSMTRLPAAGAVTVAGERHAVRGELWFDREWSTSALGADQVGWDWFSLQLENGEELMWYRLRRQDGSVDPHSRGSFVGADGRAVRLLPEQVQVEPRGTWTAPDGGASYPAGFQLRVADPACDLEVVPLLADQELRVLVRYWEGAVAVRGTRNGRPVAGVGYLEMTGYTAPPPSPAANR